MTRRHLIPTRRLLAGVAATLALALTASACDSSPYAASVDGSVIRQTALNQMLGEQAGDTSFVKAFDTANKQSGVAVVGDAAGTYSSRFVAFVLGNMVQATIVAKDLAAQHRPVPPAALAAARSVGELSDGAIWLTLPASYRTVQVQATADEATLGSVAVPAASLRTIYTQARSSFFARVCTRSITVSVTGADGGLDRTASQAEANRIADDYNLTRNDPVLNTSPNGVTGGAVTCYSQTALEDQGATFFNKVVKLGVGQAAPPVASDYGYTVLAVSQRTYQPFSLPLEKVLSAAVLQANGQADPALVKALGAAKVKINPSYGSWDAQHLTVTAPTGIGISSS